MNPAKQYHHRPEPIRRRAFTVFACLLLFSLHAKADEWYESYARGKEAFNNQQWQEAIGRFTDAINERSESSANAKTYGMHFIDYFPYLYRGVAYFKIGDKVKALADLERADKEHVVGDARQDADAPQLLRQYLELARKSNTPLPDQNYAQGMKFYNQKNYRAAIESFKAVPESSPQHKDALRYLGLAQSQQQAVEAEAAQKEKKERASNAFASGVRYYNEKSLDKAEEQFKAVLQIDNARADARDYLEKIEKLRSAARIAENETRPANVEVKKTSPPPAKTKASETHEPPRAPLVEHSASREATTESPAQGILHQGEALYQEGKILQAKEKFLALKAMNAFSADADRYLQDIASLQKEALGGIRAFFEGDYDQAITKLKQTSANGTDDPHVLAFLACSYAAEYLLKGAEDKALRQRAVEAFALAKAVDASYALNTRYISPQIVALLGQR